MEKPKVTQKQVMLYQMARNINYWLHSHNDNPKFVHRIDMECEIRDELNKAMDEAIEICIKHRIGE